MPAGTPMPAPSFADILSFWGTAVAVAEAEAEVMVVDADEEVDVVCEVTAEVFDAGAGFETAGPDGLGAIVVTALPRSIMKVLPGVHTQVDAVAFRASSKQQYPSVSLPHIESTEFMLYPTITNPSALMPFSR